MPDTFVVTTPTTTVSLGGDPRAGQVAFTVSNIAGRPMRTRLRPVPQEPMTPDWLAVQGGEERTLALGATETYTVAVTVPAGVAAGTYTFRADAVGEDSPDEDFQTGPTVSLTVPPAVAKPKFPWWIVAAAAAVIVVGVAIFVLINRSGDDGGPVASDTPVTAAPTPTASVAIPAVVGLLRSNATTQLEALGLNVQAQTVQSSTPLNTCDPPVLIVFPAAGTPVLPGTQVFIGVQRSSPTILCLNNPSQLFTLGPLFTFSK